MKRCGSNVSLSTRIKGIATFQLISGIAMNVFCGLLGTGTVQFTETVQTVNVLKLRNVTDERKGNFTGYDASDLIELKNRPVTNLMLIIQSGVFGTVLIVLGSLLFTANQKSSKGICIVWLIICVCTELLIFLPSMVYNIFVPTVLGHLSIAFLLIHGWFIRQVWKLPTSFVQET